jgi:hypothetical protein
MKKFWFFTIFFILKSNLYAQYTDIINSNRPGKSESPYSVGTDVFQVESGFFYGQGDSQNMFSIINPVGGNLFLRYGKFNEKLEINSQIIYQENDLQFKNIFTSSTQIGGISAFNVGVKYLIYERKYTDKSKEIKSWKKRMAFDKNRWIPSVGVYIGVHTNFVSDDYKSDGITPRVALLLQNNFSDRLNLITNIGTSNISSDYAVYTYIVTMTYAINQLVSFFVEHQGDLSKYDNDFQFGGGLAYLYSKNFQLDLAVRASLGPVKSGYVAGVGASWRLDMHQDELIKANQGGKKYKNDGFFSRLFKRKNK